MPSRKKPNSQIPNDTLAAFKALHEQFSTLIALRPWELVHESVLLGVQHPATGEVYYAYFMGELGEVVGFNLYDAANVAIWRHTLAAMQEDEENFSPSQMLTHTFLQFTASKKSDLEQEVIALHDAAGITIPRGQAGYTEPVGYEAGYTPGLPGAADFRLAADVIPGFICLMERIESGFHTDAVAQGEKGIGLVAFRGAGGSGAWDVEPRPLPKPKAPGIYAAEAGDDTLWEPLTDLPRTDDVYAFYAEMLPLPFSDDDGRGTFSVLMLCISQQAQGILQFAQAPAPQWKGEAADALAGMLAEIGTLPGTFAVADGPLRPLIASCGAALSVPVVVSEQAAAAGADAFGFIASQMGMMDDLG